jgi:uncharacterized protein (TIGR00251 family)
MLTHSGKHLLLHVKVIPNSSRTEIAGTLGKPPIALKVKVAQPPEDGRANRAVVALLAETLGVPQGRVVLISGQTRPQKVFQIEGIGMEAAMVALGVADGGGGGNCK